MASLYSSSIVEPREQLTMWVMAGRSVSKHIFSSVVGIGSRLQDLLLVLRIIDSISSFNWSQ